MPSRLDTMLFAATLLALAPAPALALPRDPEAWIRVESRSFTLFSDASESATLEIAARLETFRAVLARLHPGLEVSSPLPTFIYVFKNDDAFTPYKKTYARAAVNMDGYFVGHRDGNYVAIDASPQGDPFGPVYHEYVHYFVNNNFPHLPLWFNEGIAECYRTFTFEKDRVEIGRPPEEYRQWLRANRPIPITALIAIDADSKEYNERERQGVFYAESWALVHDLLYGGRDWKSRLPEYLARLDRGETLASLVKPAGYDDLDRELDAYLKRGRFLYSIYTLGDLAVDTATRVAPMPREEVLRRLGDFLARSAPGHEKDAEAHFREALRINPSHAASYAGLGFLRDESGRHEEAEALYEKALALDPGDYLTCFLEATSLMDRFYPKGLSTRSLAEGSSSSLLRARELFARSIRLRPNLGEAYAGLGSTYAFETNDVAAGIAALEKAKTLLPWRKDVVFNLAGLYARSGAADRANDLVENVLVRFGDVRMLREAREALLQGDLLAAEAALNGGRLEEGLAILRRVGAATGDPGLKAQIESHIREVGTIRAKNRQIERYNQAVDRVNGKDYEGARTLLEKVVEESSDRPLVERAKKLLADVKRAEARAGRPAH